MIYVKVSGSETLWFAMVPWRTRLFITDSVNWEEGASAKAALSASLSFSSPDIAPFLFSYLIFLSLLLKSSLWTWQCPSGTSGRLSKEYTHSLSQAHCLTAAVSHKQDHNWYFTAYLFCKLSSLPVSGELLPFGQLFWQPKTFSHTSKSCILD